MSSIPDLIMAGLNSVDGANIFTQLLHQQGLSPDQFWKPPVDIINDETTLTVYMDIPGIPSDTLSVDFFNNKLEISGQRHKPYTNFLSKEIVYGNFERKITLPISVTNSNSVTVTAKDGVLKVVINKSNEERNRFSVSINSNNT